MLKMIKWFVDFVFSKLNKNTTECQVEKTKIIQNAIGKNVTQIGVQNINGITLEEARKVFKEEREKDTVTIATDEEFAAMLKDVGFES